jgi:hypothetical protein
MKRKCLSGCIALLLSFSAIEAQVAVPVNQHPVEKPLLFSTFPDKLSCTASALQNLFMFADNSALNIQFNDLLPVSGMVLQKVIVTRQQVSINIRCSNFHDALLNVSRIIQPDGSILFTGRLVHPAFGDVLLLTQEKGQYYFIKQRQLLSMVE